MGYSEADTRAKLIDPAIHARSWTEDLIRREETAGAIEVIGGKARKRARGRVDYLLRVRMNAESQPVAVALIEAKAEDLAPGHGLEQAKMYAECRRLNVPFVFASNGRLFVEYDRTTSVTSDARPLAEFPTPEALRARYEEAVGVRLADPAARPLLVRYTGGEATRRYYQDAAIRAVFEKLARGEKRALLALATGAGKTVIAVNLLKRIADARDFGPGQLRRALFVCDRDELRRQAAAAFQNAFGADATAVSQANAQTNAQTNARILIATTSRSACLFGLLVVGLLCTVALDGHEIEDDGVVDHAVYCGHGRHGVLEDAVPIREDEVGRQDDAAPLVALGQQREEDLHLVAIVLHVADVVEDDARAVIQLGHLLG
jgi:type I restriction enzyme R subunit